MFDPSTLKRTTQPVVKKASGSTYVFEDAYSGDYEFFEGRPIKLVGLEEPAATIVTPDAIERMKTLKGQLEIIIDRVDLDPTLEGRAEKTAQPALKIDIEKFVSDANTLWLDLSIPSTFDKKP
jgi:hypothetical protein